MNPDSNAIPKFSSCGASLQADKVLHADWRFRSRVLFNLVRYRRVVEAIVQSAAIYSTASIALVVTSFLSPNIGYVACLSVFPQLIVRSWSPQASFWTSELIVPNTDCTRRGNSLGCGVLPDRHPHCAQVCAVESRE